MPLTVGGGVTSINDIQQLLSSGADKVSINTAAVKNPQLIQEAAISLEANALLLPLMQKKSKKTLGKFLPMEEESLLGLAL